MEPEHESKTSSELKTKAATNPFEGKNLSSSSSSSSLDRDEISPHKANKESQLASNRGDEEIPVSSMPRPEENCDELSTTQSPPTQVMERADEFGNADPNRLPAHVFDRSKSSAPVEWSVCSNESLFSIHMGNMSFTRDQVNWMGKSGELGEYKKSGDLGYISEYPIDFSSNQPPSSQTSELNMKKNGNLNQGMGATEAAAAETMREVIRENAAASSELVHSPEKLSPRNVQPHPARPHHNSDDSIKSFAFPILTRDVEQSESMSVGKDKRKKQAASQPQTPKTTQPQSEPQTPNPQARKSQAPKEIQNAGQIKWLACFSCCPFCS